MQSVKILHFKRKKILYHSRTISLIVGWKEILWPGPGILCFLVVHLAQTQTAIKRSLHGKQPTLVSNLNIFPFREGRKEGRKDGRKKARKEGRKKYNWNA